jgi:peptidoglycan/LPS O-acetylase OafA/YrhL
VLSFHTQYFLGSFYGRDTAHAMLDACASSLFCRPLVNGHLAVDVFFVLSGYLVAHNLHLPHFRAVRSWDTRTGRTRSLVFFYVRRLFRIVPCFYFTFALYCFIASLIEGGPRRCDGFSEVAKNLFFYQNNFAIKDQCMAWAWTVSIEMQFYVLAPLLLYLPSALGYLCATHEWGKYVAGGGGGRAKRSPRSGASEAGRAKRSQRSGASEAGRAKRWRRLGTLRT